MIVVETCPKCGHDLEYPVQTSYPPIHVTKCPACGWQHNEKEEIIRIPFQESLKDIKLEENADDFIKEIGL